MKKSIVLLFAVIGASMNISSASERKTPTLENSVGNGVLQNEYYQSNPTSLEEIIDLEKKTWAQFQSLQTEEERQKYHATVMPMLINMRAQRDIADNFAPQLTSEEVISFGRSFVPQIRHDQMILSLDICNFIRKGINTNADIIGKAYVPNVTNVDDIDVVIHPTCLDSLGVFYNGVKEQGGENADQFWLKVKQLLEAKTIRFLRMMNWQKEV